MQEPHPQYDKQPQQEGENFLNKSPQKSKNGTRAHHQEHNHIQRGHNAVLIASKHMVNAIGQCGELLHLHRPVFDIF